MHLVMYIGIPTENQEYLKAPGIIGKVGFKVLKAANTTVKLEETRFTPNSIDGTLVIDWYGNR